MPRAHPLLVECVSLQHAVAAHSTLDSLESAAEWSSLRGRLDTLLRTVRRTVPAHPEPAAAVAEVVRVVQWNIEHGNRYDQIERGLLAHPELAPADILTLDEVDLGCARADNRDVAADLAQALGLHAAWAPLFLQTTAGRDDDPAMAAGRVNEEGLFGIAVLSRWPLGEARVVELPSPRRLQFEVERMLGRHVALVVDVLRPGAPFVVVAAHLEVHRTRAHRTRQMRAIVEALARETRPVVLAGDFNTHTFDRGLWHSALHGASALLLLPGPMLRQRLLRPDRGYAREGLFDELRRAGVEWEPFVDFAPTLQLRYDRLDELQVVPGPLHGLAERALGWAIQRGALRLDWICGRGWRGGAGHTVRGLDGRGMASDHAPIVAELYG